MPEEEKQNEPMVDIDTSGPEVEVNVEEKENKQVEVEIDILRESTADNYWERSDKFDTSIDLAYTKPGLDALARVIEKWIFHFLSIETSIKHLRLNVLKRQLVR